MEAAQEMRQVDASPRVCFSVVTDFASYPEWASDIRSVEIEERDGQGRATRVAFRVAAFGRSTSYALVYDYSEEPHRLSWKQVRGDITDRLDGSYTFEEGPGGTTVVTYHLDSELIVPMPSFLKRRAEAKIVRTALEDLATRAAAVTKSSFGTQR